jgi:DNA invertase Pin-like site-specific DNA recombinase
MEPRPLTGPPPTLRAAIAARVSSIEQDAEGKTSIAEQVDKGRTEVERRGWTLDERHVYIDRVSGKLTSRFERPLAAARAAEFDALIFTKVDRLARSLRDLLNVEAELAELGVALVCIDQPVDTTTATGRLMFQQFGAWAEYEASQIVERMTLANRASVKRGRWPGGELPWGLMLTGTRGDRDRQVVLNPAEVETIGVAWELVVHQGQSCWQVADALNRMGRLPRHAKQWNNRLLRGALQSPTLKGEMQWSKPPNPNWRKPTGYRAATGKYGPPIPVEIPAVLSGEEWLALQAALARTSTTRPIHEGVIYLLSGRRGASIITPCGGRMHGFYRADRDLRQYRCANARTEAGDARCRCPRINANDLEWLVKTHIIGLAMNPDLLAEQAKRWLNPGPATPPPTTPAEDLEIRIAVLERKRTNLALAAADLGPEAIKDAVGRVQAELDGLIRQREEWQAQGNHRAQVEAVIPEILRYSQRLWEAAFSDDGAHEWRQFLARANVRVEIQRWLKPGEYTLFGDPYPYPYLARISGELLGHPAAPSSTAG